MTAPAVLFDRAASILRECAMSPDGTAVMVIIHACVTAASQSSDRIEGVGVDDRMARLLLAAADIIQPRCRECRNRETKPTSAASGET